jgi:type I restriction enzyme, S subunit
MSVNGTASVRWKATTLGAIGKYVNGRAFKSTEWSKTGRPIIRIQDLTGSNNHPNHFDGIVEGRNVVRSGDLLISWSGSLGAYLWEGPEAVLNQHIFKVESSINKRFHYHLARATIAELERSSHGSGMVHVTKKVFEDTPVSIPSDPLVQQELANLIDALERSRSLALGHLASARQSVQNFRRSVLAAACSGSLTTDWRKRNQAIPKGAPASARLANFDIPESWSLMPLRDVAEVRGGIQKQPKRAPKQNARPYLRVANVLRGKLDLKEIHQFELFNDELNTYRLMRGDLLVVEGNGSPGEIGRAAMWDGAIEDCVHQNHIIRVRPLRVVPEYLQLFWNSPNAARAIADLAVTTAGLYSLSTKKIASVLIAVPPAAEQSAIVAIVNQLQTTADRVADAIDDATRAVDRSSVALLKAAFRKGQS